MKQVSESTGAFYQHYPRTAVIVCAYHEGKTDAMTCTWHCPLSSKPPLFGILLSPKRFTYQLIIDSGEFSVNFMASESAGLLAAVGGTKGATTDKFAAFSIAKDIPLKTNAPVLADAYAAYECKLTETRQYGDHQLIVGEVVAVHWLAEAFSEDGSLDMKAVTPAFYLGNDKYITKQKSTIDKVERTRS
ncbi:NADH-FMN oxidoreductase RutF, flavin reductase (DIM6/NTAB) family [Dehalogenimonas formicexedens]|uniref:NADH-FMN oxidoreductase RutF, flavin reductase (DIM6/NTAB) family n=1 Tax=Dehalogenimonas formicexedens TaxID=1839801 RepID=A0A1P8F7R0_9CHLR|nr:flavin reductase family protein [Dehalogenimonas formicexedens]APV44412.1 NADH-FMN oxidoreductase RutF, flavin reductase (DIM6/NTAB) family [Dehalogenimonas formicexedens]